MKKKALSIKNTLTQKKELFRPIEPGRVRLYVCGVTVYDHCHIGHARVMLFFDVLVRVIKSLGFRLIYVRNITDIDDKILKRAKEIGVPYQRLAEEMIGSFNEDMDWLGIKKPNFEPRATLHIDSMIKLISILLDKSHAYKVGGDVYFSVRSFKEFGALSKKQMDDLLSGARVDVDPRKKDPLDFALWKSVSGDEASFKSPFGMGRPGWHIECSSMAMQYLGDTFDIHGGGEDLIFPHHENERMQSMAATGKPFANVWMHVGFVRMDKGKMSKSLGNIVLIKELKERWDPEVVRLALLSSHYRSPLDFSNELLESSKKALYRFYLARFRAKEGVIKEYADNDSFLFIHDFKERFLNTMMDDLNTPKAIGVLFEAMKFLRPNENTLGHGSFLALEDFFATVNDLLGVFGSNPEAFLEMYEKSFLADINLDKMDLISFIESREVARREKDFEKADEIRDQLGKLGVYLDDTPRGTLYRLGA